MVDTLPPPQVTGGESMFGEVPEIFNEDGFGEVPEIFNEGGFGEVPEIFNEFGFGTVPNFGPAPPPVPPPIICPVEPAVYEPAIDAGSVTVTSDVGVIAAETEAGVAGVAGAEAGMVGVAGAEAAASSAVAFDCLAVVGEMAGILAL